MKEALKELVEDVEEYFQRQIQPERALLGGRINRISPKKLKKCDTIPVTCKTGSTAEDCSECTFRWYCPNCHPSVCPLTYQASTSTASKWTLFPLIDQQWNTTRFVVSTSIKDNILDIRPRRSQYRSRDRANIDGVDDKEDITKLQASPLEDWNSQIENIRVNDYGYGFKWVDLITSLSNHVFVLNLDRLVNLSRFQFRNDNETIHDAFYRRYPTQRSPPLALLTHVPGHWMVSVIQRVADGDVPRLVLLDPSAVFPSMDMIRQQCQSKCELFQRSIECSSETQFFPQQITDDRNFCGVWSLMVAVIVALNPDRSMDDIIQYIIFKNRFQTNAQKTILYMYQKSTNFIQYFNELYKE